MPVQLIFTGTADSVMAEMLSFIRGAGPLIAASRNPAPAVEATAEQGETPAQAEPQPAGTDAPPAPEEPAKRRTRQPKLSVVTPEPEPAKAAEPAEEPAKTEPEVTREMVVQLAQQKVLDVGSDEVREVAVRFNVKTFRSLADDADLPAIYAALQALKA